MMLVLDPSSHVTPYEQVQRQIEALVADGTLAPAHRLPTVRRLAGDLGLAVNTVARAYRELEHQGVVITRGRHGTFVATRGVDRDREGALAAQQYAKRLRELGFDVESAVRLAQEAFA